MNPFVILPTARRGYSIKYMQKDELITDVLRQYMNDMSRCWQPANTTYT